ncbi:MULTISPECIES: hypothetical protein [Pectobacterium]|uniref:hypothetical protein n=1 Tax=Pectobacterium TaxID=122277 RepID=UPI0013C456E7|nr:MULTISPECIES: hypothetical protein [Pectobacterium]MCA6960992.1 hypothetical protein [Pectobacterium odoriferum]MCH5009103.1 hypothetical protein [Pectobacterium odoriferum]
MIELFNNVSVLDIDRNILPLILTMNASGYITYASCQGHYFPVDRVKPYIAFKTTEINAAALERLLRNDLESKNGQLHWFWCLTGTLNHNYELVYSLAPHNPRHHYYRYRRKTLEQDFTTIQRLIKKH